MRVPKFAVGILAFLLGALTGVVGTREWFQEIFHQANALQAMQHVAAETEVVMTQYRSGKPEVAQYAIERYIGLLEVYQQRNLNISDIKILSMDIGLAYVRLGKLADKAGDSARASDAYAKGLATYTQSAKKAPSLDDLKRLVQNMDEAAHP
jgi:hypothetical protein